MKASKSASPWMSPAEAADYLGVAVGTLRNWVYRRHIPFARRGRVVRFHRDRLDAWLASGSGISDPEAERKPVGKLPT